MAKSRRNTIWFWVFLVALVVAVYEGVTLVNAGSQSACNGGAGSIAFTTDSMPPRFYCKVGFG